MPTRLIFKLKGKMENYMKLKLPIVLLASAISLPAVAGYSSEYIGKKMMSHQKMEKNMENNKNLAEIAMSNPDFSTLVAAVKAAGLVDALSGDAELTVFAPTNAAFQKLPKGTLEALLADKEKLANILKYHIVAGKVLAKDVVNLDSANALNGDELEIEVKDGKVFIQDAQVIKTDVLGKNGVIHVIDTVLIPE
jgi:uncharacterized surface protein with fasciclin (FAS1) repeats